jgi:predicted nucleic acid-binding protein
MTNPRFLDTNILLYSISRDPTETTKHDRAVALIDAGDNALSVQVLQELYVQATRPTRPDPLPHDIAAALIRTCTLQGAGNFRAYHDWRIGD